MFDKDLVDRTVAELMERGSSPFWPDEPVTMSDIGAVAAELGGVFPPELEYLWSRWGAFELFDEQIFAPRRHPYPIEHLSMRDPRYPSLVQWTSGLWDAVLDLQTGAVTTAITGFLERPDGSQEHWFESFDKWEEGPTDVLGLLDRIVVESATNYNWLNWPTFSASRQ